MARRRSHQAEVEARHIQRGSWSPGDDYYPPFGGEEPWDYASYSYPAPKPSKMSESQLASEKRIARHLDALRRENPALSFGEALALARKQF